jgi:hypothetical protein
VTGEYHWLDGRYDRLPSLITSHDGFRCVARIEMNEIGRSRG